VHGGTTRADLRDALYRAVEKALMNRQQWPTIRTVLFMDEANTTEAIGSIKEILCDGHCDGVRIPPDSGLCVVAACNPYRKYVYVFLLSCLC
jgi:hypothetical protein